MSRRRPTPKKPAPIKCSAPRGILTQPDVIECRLPVAFTHESPPDLIQVMPGGVHTITAQRAGNPVTVRVEVTPQTAAVLNAAIQALSENGTQRPYFDFDHDNKAAACWPQEFSWQAGPAAGVFAKVVWSKPGADAVLGKSYRAFSPSFYVDGADPAKVTGAPLNMGGLVNDPAFKQILPLWAKDAAGAHSSLHTTKNTMTPEEIAALQAKLKQLEQENAALKAKTESAETQQAIAAKDAELADTKTKLEAAQAALHAQRAESAKAHVTAAVKRGAIPPKDAALQARYQALLEADPSNLVLLEALPSAPATQTGRTVSAAQVQVTGEDPANVLRAYHAERDGRARGNLYARELGPILAKAGCIIGLDRIASEERDRRGRGEHIDAANSLGTLVGNIISQRTLELLKLQLPALGRITIDFSDEQVNMNQAVYTRYVTVPTVASYHATTGYMTGANPPAIGSPPASATGTDAYVTINRHQFIQHVFSATELSGTARRLIEDFAPAAAYSLAKDLIDYVYALIVVGTFTETTIKEAAINFGRSTVIDIGTAQTLLGVPQGAANRTLLLYPTYFGNLAKDSAIVTLAAFQRPDIITGGILPDVHGYQVIEAANLPTTSNMTGFAFSKSALIAATRLPVDYTTALPGASFGSVQTVVNPDTGAACVQTMYVDHNIGAANFRLAWMYGASAGQPKAGQILVSA